MSFKHITSSAAKDLLEDNKEAILVDIRDHDSFNMDHDERAFHLTQDSLPDFLINVQKDIPVLVICYHGNSSQMVAQFLIDNGFTEVYSVDGGYELW